MLYVPPMPTIIHTVIPEEEIWHCINELTDYHHVNYLLNYRLNKSSCFSRFREHFDSLVKLKDKYNRENKGNRGKTKIHQLLSDKKEIESNAEEIIILVKQAIELYKSSQNSSIYAKPLLLYYSYAKLQRILFLSTYKSAPATGAHGLSYSPDNKCIICHKDGAFVRFHDSYSWDPTVYLDGCTFRWTDLLLCEPTDLVMLILNMKRGNIVSLNDNTSTTYREHELTREIIFTLL
jgi:hypothetical protein